MFCDNKQLFCTTGAGWFSNRRWGNGDLVWRRLSDGIDTTRYCHSERVFGDSHKNWVRNLREGEVLSLEFWVLSFEHGWHGLGGLSLIFLFVKFVEFVVCGSYCRSGFKHFYSYHKCCLNALFPLWGIKEVNYRSLPRRGGSGWQLIFFNLTRRHHLLHLLFFSVRRVRGWFSASVRSWRY